MSFAFNFKNPPIFIILLFFLNYKAIGQENKFLNYGLFQEYVETRKEYLQETAKYRIRNEILPIKNGERVASIGAGNGKNEVLYAMFSDSVYFYIQDLVKVKSLKSNFYINLHQNKVASKKKHSYDFIQGTKTHTNLPNNIFDIIVISNAFHEFTEVDSMLVAIKRNLKPDGKLIVIEKFSTPLKEYIYEGCKKTGYTYNRINQLMNVHGFYNKSISFPKSSIDNVMTFTQDSTDIFSINKDFEFIESLNNTDWPLGDSEFTAIENQILKNQDDINSVYKEFPWYLYRIGEDYAMKQDFKSALKILKLCRKMYPENIFISKLLGQAYYFNGEFESASLEFEKYTISEDFKILKSNFKHFKDKSIKYQKKGVSFTTNEILSKELKYFKVKKKGIKYFYYSILYASPLQIIISKIKELSTS